jgi:hypothetical protein
MKYVFTGDECMKCIVRTIILLGIATILTVFTVGCSIPVLKQDIPVSTNPLGAKIYANGQLMGLTPTTVSLERNRSHVLTLIKDNYRQEDVIITNRYQKEKVYLKAIQSGINSGLFFKSGSMGVGSSMNSFSSQEASGEAYILYPPAITVNLRPLSGTVETYSGQPPTAPSYEATTNEMQAPPMRREEMTKELLRMGAGAATSQMPPIERKIKTSSSSKDYVKPDGTRVHEKSSSSVSVGVNPAGLVNVIDMLFK